MAACVVCVLANYVIESSYSHPRVHTAFATVAPAVWRQSDEVELI